TPWTLPANQFVAVHPDLEYVVVEDERAGDRLIVAAVLADALAEKTKTHFSVVRRMMGRELVGRRYVPPFDFYAASSYDRTGKLRDGGEEPVAWRVVAADFVTVESGTGLVHQAPAFGEVDYEVLLREQQRFVEGEGPELLCPVAPDGTFTDPVTPWKGQWVKDADKSIIRNLKERGLLWHQEQYLHDYPFCWRAEQDPLIQYPRRSWFIRTTEFREQMLENNRHIRWLPEHIRDGRFGNFLESNVDWALSRERFWGTPLPIWVCEATGRMEAVASYAELLAKPGVEGTEVWEEAKRQHPELPDDLKVHKPYIDAVTYDSPFQAGARMRRVSEVIDCWYDSGAMPFAQWGYPHRGKERFTEQFPADFISEALDQTRGWFYSLLAISTMLFGPQSQEDSGERDPTTPMYPWPHPYRTCIVLGLMLGEDGNKMSKSKRNYREPSEIFDRYGADALRWYFFANQAPWTSIRYREQAIRESIPEFLLRLWNVFSFFVIYANIDGFDPAERLEGEAGQLGPDVLARGRGYRPLEDRCEIDRWILSELHQTTAAVIEHMDAYDNFPACRRLHRFVDALSNWYVRRNRERFWSGDVEAQDKIDAYWTLYEVLLTTSKLIAPFTPFLAETLWRHLTGVFGDRAISSVHLCDYPTPETQAVDATLSQRMALLREIASLGRAARASAKLKVRQPLARAEVVLADQTHLAWLQEHASLLSVEINVKEVEFTTAGEEYIEYKVVPNFKRLGPKLGKNMPKVKQWLEQADGAALLRQLQQDGHVSIELPDGTVELTSDDIEVRLQARSGWTAAQGEQTVVVLSTELTPELIQEGWVRDLVRHIQERRKAIDCDYTDRIAIGLVTESEEVREAVRRHEAYVRRETLAESLEEEALPNVSPVELEVGGHKVSLSVRR
ncbi:MAG TPA: isoleucine--tRNA ligase, partial [Planctomycetaceae bacterium]|nr:isoleucine--tRNA ligase [Planctomycetaceae bacterium]